MMKKINVLNASDRTERLATRRATKRGVPKCNGQENAQQRMGKSMKNKRSVSEMSPNKPPITRKRTAFGDITNAIQAHSDRLALARKKVAQKKPEIISIAKTRSRRSDTTKNNQKCSVVTKEESCPEILDNVLNSDLITSSNENQNSVKSESQNASCILLNTSNLSNTSMVSSDLNVSKSRPVPNLPPSIIAGETPNKIVKPKVKPLNLRPYDTDNDPFVVSEYAESVFINMKKREVKFPVKNYLTKSFAETTGPMRAILIDWLVEVQENFELYHETLYLAIKIVDNYLQDNNTPKEQLQLVGATSLLIACKIEERQPPPLDDFQFICDDAYTHKLFVQMEIKILKALDFDINLPHAYRFLRRFARVTSMSMQTLTLSRYILELSLHEAKFVDVAPSKLAAVCLCLALKMKFECDWDTNLIYHTGYLQEELSDLMISMNTMVENAPNSKLQTVRTKYSHQIFYEVAKIPPADPLNL